MEETEKMRGVGELCVCMCVFECETDRGDRIRGRESGETEKERKVEREG